MSTQERTKSETETEPGVATEPVPSPATEAIPTKHKKLNKNCNSTHIVLSSESIFFNKRLN